MALVMFYGLYGENMKLWFRINGLEFCSWLIVYKYLMRAFKQVGAEVHGSPFNPPPDVGDYVELHWADPAFWQLSDTKPKLKAGYALSEHRSLLRPEQAIANLQKCDVLLCPCQSAAQAYYEAPLDMPIRIAPFGVDEGEMKFHSRKWDKELRFLLIGVAQFRKGTWLAVEAFQKAFNDNNNPDVSLTVASFTETAMFARLKQDYQRSGNINFVGKTEDVKELYHNHHVLLSPHLAEGWALSIPESMATGMPAIVARCSAPREYFSHEYGWWQEMSDLYAPVDQCLEGVRGSWRLPSVDSLVEKLRYTNEHREECEQKGKAASEYVLANLTWRQSAQKVIDILSEYI